MSNQLKATYVMISAQVVLVAVFFILTVNEIGSQATMELISNHQETISVVVGFELAAMVGMIVTDIVIAIITELNIQS